MFKHIKQCNAVKFPQLCFKGWVFKELGDPADSSDSQGLCGRGTWFNSMLLPSGWELAKKGSVKRANVQDPDTLLARIKP